MPGGTTCAFRGCHSKEGQGISMFSFPKDPERVTLWLEACHRTDLFKKIPVLFKTFKLCELHFEEQYISKGSTRKHLLPNACPTIFHKQLQEEIKHSHSQKKTPEEPSKKLIGLSDIPVVPPFKDRPIIEACESDKEPSSLQTYFTGPSMSKDATCELTVFSQHEVTEAKQIIPTPLSSPTLSMQTSLQLTSNTPRKWRLKREIRLLSKRVAKKESRKALYNKEEPATLEDFCKLCDIFLNEPLADITKSHATLKAKKRLSHRYSKEVKQKKKWRR